MMATQQANKTVIRMPFLYDPIEYTFGETMFSPVVLQFGENTIQIKFELSLFHNDVVWIQKDAKATGALNQVVF
jgi:hypothetical protein